MSYYPAEDKYIAEETYFETESGRKKFEKWKKKKEITEATGSKLTKK